MRTDESGRAQLIEKTADIVPRAFKAHVEVFGNPHRQFFFRAALVQQFSKVGSQRIEGKYGVHISYSSANWYNDGVACDFAGDGVAAALVTQRCGRKRVVPILHHG